MGINYDKDTYSAEEMQLLQEEAYDLGCDSMLHHHFGVVNWNDAAAVREIIKPFLGLGSAEYLKTLVDADKAGRIMEFMPGDIVYDRSGESWRVIKTEYFRTRSDKLSCHYNCKQSLTGNVKTFFAGEISYEKPATDVVRERRKTN